MTPKLSHIFAQIFQICCVLATLFEVPILPLTATSNITCTWFMHFEHAHTHFPCWLLFIITILLNLFVCSTKTRQHAITSSCHRRWRATLTRRKMLVGFAHFFVRFFLVKNCRSGFHFGHFQVNLAHCRMKYSTWHSSTNCPSSRRRRRRRATCRRRRAKHAVPRTRMKYYRRNWSNWNDSYANKYKNKWNSRKAINEWRFAVCFLFGQFIWRTLFIFLFS